jgi:hypothetical protein
VLTCTFVTRSTATYGRRHRPVGLCFTVNIDDLRRRQGELKADVKAKNALFEAGEISKKSYDTFIDHAYREHEQLEATAKNFQSGQAFSLLSSATKFQSPRADRSQASIASRRP